MPAACASVKCSPTLVVLTAVLAGWFCRMGMGPATAQPPTEKSNVWETGKFDGASYCMRCHTYPSKNDAEQGSLDLVLLTEYAVWKTHDKHAQAFAVLEGPRAEKMARHLEMEPSDLTKERGGCLNCHAMNYIAKRQGQNFAPQDGVSCGGCHGPSELWGRDHAQLEWRKKTAEEKQSLGMRDLRDPATRAKLCVSCHIGNASEGKVLTHAMLAAGHPPLPPIEIATFSRNEPQHWRDAHRVPYFQKNASDQKVRANYHLEDLGFQRTKLALVGGLVALRETMVLLRDRAGGGRPVSANVWPELLTSLNDADLRNAEKVQQAVSGRWPEVALAHADCYACHHDLRYPGYRQARGFGYRLASRPLIALRPGRPPLRSWSLTLPEAWMVSAGKPEALNRLAGPIEALAKASDLRPFGLPNDVRQAAERIIQWCDVSLADLKSAGYSSESVLRLMDRVCQSYGPSSEHGRQGPFLADYECARQLASLLQVGVEDLSRNSKLAQFADKELQKILNDMAADLNLQPYTKRPDRLKVIMGVVKELSGNPKLEGMEEFSKYIEDIGNPSLLKRFIDHDNDFLAALQRRVGPKEFTDQLKRGAVVEQLQNLGDEEQRQVLESLANYDPNVFREHLAELAERLAGRKP